MRQKDPLSSRQAFLASAAEVFFVYIQNASLTSHDTGTALLAIKKLTSQQNKWAKPGAMLIEFAECVPTIERR